VKITRYECDAPLCEELTLGDGLERTGWIVINQAGSGFIGMITPYVMHREFCSVSCVANFYRAAADREATRDKV